MAGALGTAGGTGKRGEDRRDERSDRISFQISDPVIRPGKQRAGKRRRQDYRAAGEVIMPFDS